MTIIHVGGVDPGLVHTGVVSILLNSKEKTIKVWAETVEGTNAAQVASLFKGRQPQIFIEKYEDRGTVFSTHGEMRVFEVELSKALPHATILSNTGSRQVVNDLMMAVLGCGTFPTTNHRDLESAARIALYGALKDDASNAIIYQAFNSYLEGKPWQIL